MPTYDTYIELLPESEQTRLRKTYTYGYDKHLGIKGFQKLINQWAKCFLTAEGTHPSDEDYGTRVPLLIGANVTSRKDILDVIQAGVSQTNATIARYQASHPPDDDEEVLEDAALTGLDISATGDGVEIYVRIKNQAGRALRVALPPVTLSGG